MKIFLSFNSILIWGIPMAEGSNKLKTNILNARNKVKEARLTLTGGVIENKAKEAGKSVSEFCKDTFKELDESLSDISKDLSVGAFTFGDKMKHEAEELAKTIEKVHQDVRNERRVITGGYIEDKTIEALKSAEDKLEKFINGLKD
jgi:gas vesicle protein